MGAINNMAGAAGAIGLIALEMAGGLGTVTANASLRLGALTIGIAGLVGFKSRGQAIPPRAWIYGLLAIPGAIAGAWLAVTLPVWVYRSVLITILLAVLAQQLRNRTPDPSTKIEATRWWPLLFLLIGLHMGFIQVAAGLLSILVLTTLHRQDLVATNAAKMAIMICAAGAAVVYFASAGKIEWGPAAALAIGCGAGSFWASRWSIDKGHAKVRLVVLAITVTVLLWAVWQITTTS